MKNNHYLYYCHEIIDLTPDIAKLTFICVDRPLTYQAGQYVQIELPDGVLPLSIANVQNPAGTLEFHLRHNKTHALAQQLLTAFAKNKSVKLSGPFGNSTLQQAVDYEKLVFLAGGTGFAPIKSLLQNALAQKQFKTLILYWGICRPIDAYEEALLTEWQQHYPHFQYTLVLSEPENFDSWQGATGLVHSYYESHCHDLGSHCVFMSGPYPMLKSVQALFEQQKQDNCKLVSDLMEALT